MKLPVINTLGRLVGALYVLEDPTLGGQLISRQLNQHFGLTLQYWRPFFYGYGEQTAVMWQSFIDFADCISGDESQCQAAEQSACQTFQVLNQVLDDYVQQELTLDLA
jgi:heme oxygenase